MADRQRMIMRNRNKVLMKKRMGQLIDQVVKVKRAKEMSKHVRARNNSKRRAERVKELRKISHVAKERLSDVRRSLSDVPRVTRSRPGDAEREMASRRLFKTGNQLGTSTRRPKRTEDQVRGTYMRYLRNTGALAEEMGSFASTSPSTSRQAVATKGQIIKSIGDADHRLTGEQVAFVVRRLRKVPFLAALPAEKLRELAQRTTIKSYQRTERIFRQGESCTQLLIVLSGEISVTRTYKVAKDTTLQDAAARFSHTRHPWEQNHGPPPVPRNPDGMPMPKWGKGCRQNFGAGRRLDIDIWSLNRRGPDEGMRTMHLPAPAPVKQAQHGGHDDDSGDFITRTECHALKENHYFGDRALQGMWSTPGVGVAETFVRLLVLSREQYQAAMMTAQGGQVDARTSFLGRVDLFREAQDDMLVNLGGGCAEGEYKAGTRILSAGQENDMLYFVTSGSCRESVVTTQQEVAAKQARLKALAKDVHRKAPLYVPPPHPTRANTLKEQLAARGRSSLAGPSGVERASYAQLVPIYTDGDAATGGSALDDRPDVGDEDGSTTPVDGAAWGNLRGFVSHSLLQRHVVDVGVGQAFGDVAALLSIRQPTDVTAHTDVTVLSISKNAFRTRVSRAIIRRATDIARQRAKWRYYTVQGVKEAVEQVEHLVYKPAPTVLSRKPVLPPSVFTSLHRRSSAPSVHAQPHAMVGSFGSVAGAGGAQASVVTFAGESEAAASRSPPHKPRPATSAGVLRHSGGATRRFAVDGARLPTPSSLTARGAVLPSRGTTTTLEDAERRHKRRSLARLFTNTAPVRMSHSRGPAEVATEPGEPAFPSPRGGASPAFGDAPASEYDSPPATPRPRAVLSPMSPLAVPADAASTEGLVSRPQTAAPASAVPRPFSRGVGDSFGTPSERAMSPPSSLAALFGHTPVVASAASGGGVNGADTSAPTAWAAGEPTSTLPLPEYEFVPAPTPEPPAAAVHVPDDPATRAAAIRVQALARGRASRRRVRRMRGEDDSAEVKLQREMSALDERLRRASTPATSRRRAKEGAASSSPTGQDGGRSTTGDAGVTTDNGTLSLEGDGGEPRSKPTAQQDATSTATEPAAEPSGDRGATTDAADIVGAAPGEGDGAAQGTEEGADGDGSGEGASDMLDSQEQALREELEHLNTQLLLKRPSTSSSRGGRWNRRIQPRR